MKENINRGDERENYYDYYVENFVKKNFLHLIANNIEIAPNNKISGDKFNLSKVKKSFRNINIVTHSYGGFVAEQIGNALKDYMQQLGYQNTEITQALEQISLLSLGNVATLSNDKSNLTALHIINKNDPMVKQYSDNLTYAEKIAGSPLQNQSKQRIILQDPKVRLVFYEGNVSVFSRRDKHHLFNHINFSLSKTKVETETAPNPAANYLRNCLDNSIFNSAENQVFTPLPDHDYLINHVPQQIKIMQEAFNKQLNSLPR